MEVKIINCKIKIDEIGKPYVEYILRIKYNGKSWKINKKFSHFTQLYNNLNILYKDIIKLPINLSNVFDTKNTTYNFNENKIQQLQKFLNEVINTNVINSSKIFLKFIQFDNFYLHKNFEEGDKEWFLNKLNDNYNKISTNNLIGDINNYNNYSNNLTSSFRVENYNNKYKNNNFNEIFSANYPQNLFKTNNKVPRFKNMYNDIDNNNNFDDIDYHNENIGFDENINENYGYNEYY